MTDLVKCCAKSEPVLQERGKMARGDYFGVKMPNGEHDHDHHLKVEITHDVKQPDGRVEPGNATNVRVICKHCHMATGWNHRDMPNMPFAGQDFVVKQWNAMATAKKQRTDMMAHLEKQFGAEVVAKHFAAA